VGGEDEEDFWGCHFGVCVCVIDQLTSCE
jgi:hypothetical protein